MLPGLDQLHLEWRIHREAFFEPPFFNDDQGDVMPSQRIEIRPSNALTAALCLAHPGAAAAIWCAGLPSWLKGALTVAIGVGLVWSLFSRARLRAAESVVGLEITAEG